MISRCNRLLEDIRGELGEAGKSKVASLNRSIKDVERQIASQKKAIKDLSDIASPLGPKAVEVYVRKEKAHLANREALLKALHQELKDAQAKGESRELTSRPITEATASKMILRSVDGLGKASGAISDWLEGMGQERKRTREYGVLQQAKADLTQAQLLLHKAATKLKTIGG